MHPVANLYHLMLNMVMGFVLGSLSYTGRGEGYKREGGVKEVASVVGGREASLGNQTLVRSGGRAPTLIIETGGRSVGFAGRLCSTLVLECSHRVLRGIVTIAYAVRV